MPVDWKSQDAYNRLLAATVASMDGSTKLNYKRIADFYGEGATYDTIEGRFRVIKKQAAKLKEEVENGDRPLAPPRGGRSAESTPRKPKTPKKDATSVSPTKRRKANTDNAAISVTSSSATDVETPPSASTDDILSFDLTSDAGFSFPQMENSAPDAAGSYVYSSFWDEDAV